MRISDWSSDVCSSDLSTGYRRFQAGDFVVRFDVKARYRRARADAKVAALCDARTFNRLRIAGRAARRKNDARAGRNSQPAIACAKDGLKLTAVGSREGQPTGDRKSTRLNSSH